MHNGNKKIAFLILFLLNVFLYAEEVKFPNVAGGFYPLKPEELQDMINNFSKQARALPSIKGKIYGILVPHAGYVFSGGVAAYGFNIIDDYYDYVIIISTSHTSDVYGLQTYPYDAFLVPTGRVNVDKKLVKKLIKKSKLIKEVK